MGKQCVLQRLECGSSLVTIDQRDARQKQGQKRLLLSQHDSELGLHGRPPAPRALDAAECDWEKYPNM
jgi:hypothetical protein